MCENGARGRSSEEWSSRHLKSSVRCTESKRQQWPVSQCFTRQSDEKGKPENGLVKDQGKPNRKATAMPKHEMYHEHNDSTGQPCHTTKGRIAKRTSSFMKLDLANFEKKI